MNIDLLKNISIRSALKLLSILIIVFFIIFGVFANNFTITLQEKMNSVQEKELNTILFSQKLKDMISKVQDTIVYHVSLKASFGNDNFELVEEKFPEILKELNKFKEFAHQKGDKELILISNNLNFRYIMFTSKAIELFTLDDIDNEFFEMLSEVSKSANAMNKELSTLALHSGGTLGDAIKEFKNDMVDTKIIIFVLGGFVVLMILLFLWIITSNLIKKLEVLSRGINEFSHKNLSHRIDDLGKNELSHLADSFNDMAYSLERTAKEKEEKHHMLVQQSKLASMGEMIGNIAHQWRQPLSAISTSSSSVQLSRILGTLKDEEIDHNIEVVMKNCDYLSKTIDDFRNFFKPNKEKEKFNLKDLISDTLMIVKATIQNNNIKVNTKFEDTLECFGYPNELSQVLINLFNNGKDILKEKELEYKVIDINLYEEDGRSIIEVTDNGGGVPTDIIDKIFEPYFTTKHQSKGTGIGLYMSREIVVNHFEGTLKVQNKEFDYEGVKYTGAAFIIELPKVQE